MAATFHGQLTLGQGSLAKPGLCLADYTNTAGLYVSTTGISGVVSAAEKYIVFGVNGAEQLRLDLVAVKARALWITTTPALSTSCRLIVRSTFDTSIGILEAPTVNGQALTGNTNGTLLWGSVPTGSGTADTFAVWGANNVLRGSSLLREAYPVGLIEQVQANANIVVTRAHGYVQTPNIDIGENLVYRNGLLGPAIIPKLPVDSGPGTMYSLSGSGSGNYEWRLSFPAGLSPETPAGKVLKLKNKILVGQGPNIADLEWGDAGAGTVTSVGLTIDKYFNVSNQPVVGSGTIGITWASQAQYTFLAGPTTTSPLSPTFRRITPLDLAAGATNGYVLGTDGTTLSWVPQSPGGGGDLTGGGNSPTFAVWSGGKSLRDSYYLTERNTGSNNIGVVVVGHLWVEHPLVNGYVITPYIKVTEQIVYRTTGGTALSIPQLPHDTSNRMWALNGNGLGAFQWAEFTPGGGTGAGGVTSVALAAPTDLFDVTGSPVNAGSGGGTGAGTLTLTLDNQDPNKIFAGPVSGASAKPTFRRVFPLDLAPQTTANYVLSYVDSNTMAWVPQTTGSGGITTKVKFTSAVDGLTASPGTYDTDGTVDLHITGSPLPIVPSDAVGKVLKLKYAPGGFPPEADKVPAIVNMEWATDNSGSGGGIAYPGVAAPHVADTTWRILTAPNSVKITGSYSLSLDGDTPTPAINQYYGTAGSPATRGWHNLPTGGGSMWVAEPTTTKKGSLWILCLIAPGPPKVWGWYELVGEGINFIPNPP